MPKPWVCSRIFANAQPGNSEVRAGAELGITEESLESGITEVPHPDSGAVLQ